jgi:chromate transporter
VNAGPPSPPGSAAEVFGAFLKLGFTAFGGPIAHLGYFRQAFVERRRWLTDDDYAQLVALAQFLPGPASSQVGFALGLLRAGWLGAIAAFTAFTLPSVVLLLGFAAALPLFQGALAAQALHGLKLLALAVVAQAVLGMSRQLCPDAPRASIAALTAAAVLVAGSPLVQVATVAGGALAGMFLPMRHSPPAHAALAITYGSRAGWGLLGAFAALLLLLPASASVLGGAFGIADAFYRAGALVFGGGHVVLPLLEQTVVAPGWVSEEAFLAGYGAAQAVPGPMFSLAGYLGASLPGDAGGVSGAMLALAAIFLPGFLLLAGMLPLWARLAAHPTAARAVAGANAAVVGLLGAALYDPVWLSAVRAGADLAIALVAFVLLVAWRAPVLVVVVWCVAASVAWPR